MEDTNPAPTPLHNKTTLETEPQGETEVDAGHCQSIVDSLLYATTATRPDIALAILAVTNLARQAPRCWHQYHSHRCCPVTRPDFRSHSRGHPPRLGASTDLRHIAPVAISPTAGRSRPLCFVSVMLLARPSPIILTYVVSC